MTSLRDRLKVAEQPHFPVNTPEPVVAPESVPVMGNMVAPVETQSPMFFEPAPVTVLEIAASTPKPQFEVETVAVEFGERPSGTEGEFTYTAPTKVYGYDKRKKVWATGRELGGKDGGGVKKRWGFMSRIPTTAGAFIIMLMCTVFAGVVSFAAMPPAAASVTPPEILWSDVANTAWYTEEEDATVGRTSGNPFIIGTAAELAGLAVLVNSGEQAFGGMHIQLSGNIDLSGRIWVPIGTGQDQGRAFRGIIDGNTTVITMPTEGIWSPTRYMGLFGRLEYAVIRDLALIGTMGTYYNIQNASRIGALAGHAYATRLDGIINRVNIDVPVARVYTVGGVVGFVSNVIHAVNIANFGHISVNSVHNVGGIFGRVHDGVLANTFNRGGITAMEVTGGIGGLIGIRQTTGATPQFYIANVFNTGVISNGEYAGFQIIGGQTYSSLENTSVLHVRNIFGRTAVLFGGSIAEVIDQNLTGVVTDEYGITWILGNGHANLFDQLNWGVDNILPPEVDDRGRPWEIGPDGGPQWDGSGSGDWGSLDPNRPGSGDEDEDTDYNPDPPIYPGDGGNGGGGIGGWGIAGIILGALAIGGVIFLFLMSRRNSDKPTGNTLTRDEEREDIAENMFTPAAAPAYVGVTTTEKMTAHSAETRKKDEIIPGATPAPKIAPTPIDDTASSSPFDQPSPMTTPKPPMAPAPVAPPVAPMTPAAPVAPKPAPMPMAPSAPMAPKPMAVAAPVAPAPSNPFAAAPAPAPVKPAADENNPSSPW
ncbi:MAG: hypothetical protein FWE38_01140 [Firmicutes bacterium]|nr:hypothetical protein [Bacillota bacterium]